MDFLEELPLRIKFHTLAHTHTETCSPERPQSDSYRISKILEEAYL
jgi:hypothetical protein